MHRIIFATVQETLIHILSACTDIVHPFVQLDSAFIMDPTKLYHSTNRQTGSLMTANVDSQPFQSTTNMKAATQAYKKSAILVTTTRE